MPHTEKVLESTTAFSGRIFHVDQNRVELENGAQSSREIVRHNFGGACVLAETDKGVWFVRQYRCPYDEELLELPAGKIDPGEAPEQCAARELREEAGMVADTLIPLGECYPSPGYVDEHIYMYAAQNPQPAAQQLDEDEFLDLVAIPLEKAVQMVLSGEIRDAKTQIALLKWAMTHKN